LIATESVELLASGLVVKFNQRGDSYQVDVQLDTLIPALLEVSRIMISDGDFS
jgi:hypothetical protein